jgi:hypothetical protein
MGSLNIDEYIDSEFLGVGKKSKKNKSKLSTGHQSVSIKGKKFKLVPHHEYNRPGMPGVTHGNNSNQHHHTITPTPKAHEKKQQIESTPVELLALAAKEFTTYKDLITTHEPILETLFQGIETEIKAHAIKSLKAVMSVATGDAVMTWNTAVAVINNELLKFATSSLTVVPITHDPVGGLSSEGIASEFKRAWAIGYLIKEIIGIVSSHIKKNNTAAEVKTKVYFAHVTRIAAALRTQRQKVFAITLLVVKRSKQLKERESKGQTPRTVTNPFLGSELDDTFSMAQPFNT